MKAEYVLNKSERRRGRVQRLEIIGQIIAFDPETKTYFDIDTSRPAKKHGQLIEIVGILMERKRSES